MIRSIRLDDVKGENKRKIFDVIGLIANNTLFSKHYAFEVGSYILVNSSCFNSEYEMCSNVPVIDYRGNVERRSRSNPSLGIRLCADYSDIKESCRVVETLESGIKIVEYGELPAVIPNLVAGQKFYEVDKEKTFLETGKIYKLPNFVIKTYLHPSIEPTVMFGRKQEYVEVKEYVDYLGNKYVCLDSVYYLVQPVRWYVDENENFAVTEKIISGGLPYGYTIKTKEEEYVDEFGVEYYVDKILIPSLTPIVGYELPEKLEVVEKVVSSDKKSVERNSEPVLPDISNMGREELVALQAKISKLLEIQSRESFDCSSYVPKLTN